MLPAYHDFTGDDYEAVINHHVKENNPPEATYSGGGQGFLIHSFTVFSGSIHSFTAVFNFNSQYQFSRPNSQFTDILFNISQFFYMYFIFFSSSIPGDI